MVAATKAVYTEVKRYASSVATSLDLCSLEMERSFERELMASRNYTDVSFASSSFFGKSRTEHSQLSTYHTELAAWQHQQATGLPVGTTLRKPDEPIPRTSYRLNVRFAHFEPRM